MEEPPHIPVLLSETMELLDPRPGETCIDCTVGGAGHALEMVRRVGPEGFFVGIDRDASAIDLAGRRIHAAHPADRTLIRHAGFDLIPQILRERRVGGDVLLADLGFSSMQMDDPNRGLSFSREGPLDMRFDRSAGPTAAELVRTLSERELADLIFEMGEDPFARRIAAKLVEARRRFPIDSTAALSRLVREAYGRRARDSRMDPATRTFMALRIAVNDELGALSRLLEAIDREARRIETDRDEHEAWLNRGARVGIISFHSLEDRMVKRTFRQLSRDLGATLLTKKPVTAADAETAGNPRSRSAKLRAIMLGANEAATG